jgi:DNA-binding response OmpR family regulator
LNPAECTILVVDDDRHIVELIANYLKMEQYSVVTASDGEMALRKIAEHDPDLVVLDIALPRMDGLEVCRRVRATRDTPIIMLTARHEEVDKLISLSLGCDDYITKPFSLPELVARIEAVLRRARPAPRQEEPGAGETLRFPSLKINPRMRTVETDRGVVSLTVKEFDLLYFLASHRGMAFSRRQLLDQVWGYSHDADPSTVTVYIRRLREKIEADPQSPRFVKTVWGIGYKFEA